MLNRLAKIRSPHPKQFQLICFEDGKVVKRISCGTRAQARNFREMWLEGRLNFTKPEDKSKEL